MAGTALRLRFVTGDDLFSRSIRFYENFWATHVEAVMPDGTYLGAHAAGGVLARPPDYDAAKWTRQLFVDLPCSINMGATWADYLRRRVGTPYDLGAIAGFALRDGQHQPMHVICSALQVLALRACGYLERPLVVLAHDISPRDLLLVLSSLVPVGDPEERKSNG